MISLVALLPQHNQRQKRQQLPLRRLALTIYLAQAQRLLRPYRCPLLYQQLHLSLHQSENLMWLIFLVEAAVLRPLPSRTLLDLRQHATFCRLHQQRLPCGATHH